MDVLSKEYGFVKSRFAYQSLPGTCNLVDFPNETQKKKKKSRVISIVDWHGLIGKNMWLTDKKLMQLNQIFLAQLKQKPDNKSNIFVWYAVIMMH